MQLESTSVHIEHLLSLGLTGSARYVVEGNGGTRNRQLREYFSQLLQTPFSRSEAGAQIDHRLHTRPGFLHQPALRLLDGAARISQLAYLEGINTKQNNSALAKTDNNFGVLLDQEPQHKHNMIHDLSLELLAACFRHALTGTHPK